MSAAGTFARINVPFPYTTMYPSPTQFQLSAYYYIEITQNFSVLFPQNMIYGLLSVSGFLVDSNLTFTLNITHERINSLP